MRVSRMFTAFCVCLSDTASTGPTPAGIAGLRHKQRHKTTTRGQWTPSGSIGVDRQASPFASAGRRLSSGQALRYRTCGTMVANLFQN